MKMKQTEAAPPSTPPPPPPPLPRLWAKKAAPESVTKREIAKFWLQKRNDEEEHLLAAIKAAARIGALKLSEDDYRYFEESLNVDEKDGNDSSDHESEKNGHNEQVRVGIKDWWTKSRYAYLNQPAIESVDPPKRRSSSYVPNCFTHKPASLYPTSLGIF